MGITADEVLAEIGPVQEVLDAHDGVVTVMIPVGGTEGHTAELQALLRDSFSGFCLEKKKKIHI